MKRMTTRPRERCPIGRSPSVKWKEKKGEGRRGEGRMRSGSKQHNLGNS